jgi:prolipoprotein diacylglyceryltransferase
VQLYQAAHDFLLFAGIWSLSRWGNPPKGSLLPLVAMLYGIGRFTLESLRGDHVRSADVWTVSQVVSVLVLVVSAAVLVVQWSLAWLEHRAAPPRGAKEGA